MRAEGRIKVDAKFIQGAPSGWFKPGAGKTEWFKDHEASPEMVVVPAGSFMMGSPDAAHESGELPAGDGVSRDREGLGDCYLAPWALRALALRLIAARHPWIRPASQRTVHRDLHKCLDAS
jgi:hypothetical protein